MIDTVRPVYPKMKFVPAATAALFAFLGAGCGSDGETVGEIDPTRCDDAGETVLCSTDIASLESDAVAVLERAASLDDGSNVQVDSGGCGFGGDAPDRLAWSLCTLTLDDGRQAVVGRSAGPGLTAQATAGDAPIELALPTAPGEVIVLAEPASVFIILDAEGGEIGSVTGK